MLHILLPLINICRCLVPSAVAAAAAAAAAALAVISQGPLLLSIVVISRLRCSQTRRAQSVSTRLAVVPKKPPCDPEQLSNSTTCDSVSLTPGTVYLMCYNGSFYQLPQCNKDVAPCTMPFTRHAPALACRVLLVLLRTLAAHYRSSCIVRSLKSCAEHKPSTSPPLLTANLRSFGGITHSQCLPRAFRAAAAVSRASTVRGMGWAPHARVT